MTHRDPDVLEAAQRLGLSIGAIQSRLRRGVPREQALTTPRGQRGQPAPLSPRRVPMLREPEKGESEHTVEVLDTGRRRRMPPLGLAVEPRAGGYDLALVHVDGEPAPRWVAVERLDPAEHGPTPSRPLPGASPRAPRVLS